jgi:hypothetical protein
MNNKAFDRCRWLYQGALSAILLAILVIQSQAQNYTLSTGNTSLQIGLGGATPGLSDWTIGGVNQLELQWFYYSVGGANAYSIDNIAPWSTPSLTGGSTPSLAETYSNSTLSVTTAYTLESLSSSVAQLGTVITIQNLSDMTQSFNFYQYSHFGLGGVSGGQSVYFPGTAYPYTVYQYPTSGNGGYLVGSLNAAFATVGEVAGPYSASQLGLGENVSPPTFNSTTLTAGSGNVNFGYEFTETLLPDSSITISEIQTVPEPSSWALILSGILALSLFYNRGLVFKKKV